MTEEKYRICFVGFHNFDPELYDFSIVLKLLANAIDTTLAEKGVCPGYVFVLNCEGVTLSHLAKSNISHTRSLLYYIQVWLEFFLYINSFSENNF